MMVTKTAAATALAVLAAAQIEEPAGFAPGEVIVRFTADSEGRPPVTETAGEPRLDPFLATLSQEIGCPVRLRRVGSGGDLLLELDATALARHLESALGEIEEIQGVSAWSPGEKEGRPAPSAAMRARTSADPQKLADRLARDLALPVVQRSLPSGEQLFEVDFRALTLEVVDRLKRRPDVDYAQPNHRVSY